MKQLLTLILFVSLSAIVYCTPLLKPFAGPNSGQSVRTNLYEVENNGNTILLDGDFTQYDPSYSNAVDGMDAKKMSNFSENIGMLRGNVVLVIERRHTIINNDSIFYKIWNLHQLTYQLEFVMSNMDQPGMIAYLEDSYLKTNTPLDLNGTSHVNFTVTTAAASYDPMRFRIIFSMPEAGMLPLTFTSVEGFKENKDIVIGWKTSNENNISKYRIERSNNGSSFENMDSLPAQASSQNDYTWEDKIPMKGINYYRILCENKDGEKKYSNIIQIDAGAISAAFAIAPNPATGNTINLMIYNQPAGIYDIQLVNNFGQVLYVSKLQYEGGNGNKSFTVPSSLPKGMYQLMVRKDQAKVATSLSLIL